MTRNRQYPVWIRPSLGEHMKGPSGGVHAPAGGPDLMSRAGRGEYPRTRASATHRLRADEVRLALLTREHHEESRGRIGAVDSVVPGVHDLQKRVPSFVNLRSLSVGLDR